MAPRAKRSTTIEPSEDRTMNHKNPKLEAVDDQMQIYFRLMKTVPMEVKKSDAVKNVRTELSVMQGISMINLKSLSFAGNWLDIKEGKLDDYGISNGSTINVFLDSGFRMKIYIKMSQTGKNIALDVDMRDTILDIKRRIQNKEGIPVSRQDIIYLGEELDDGKPIASYNVVQDSVIYALFRPEDAMQIYVSIGQNRTTISLKVKNWYTIENIKNMIESTEGIKTTSQRLYNGMMAKLEDATTLADSHVLHGQTLLLISGMQIFVKDLTGKTLTLEVHGDYTIHNICEMIEEQEGLPNDQQRLIFNGRKLDKESTLDDNGIEEGSKLALVLRLCGC